MADDCRGSFRGYFSRASRAVARQLMTHCVISVGSFAVAHNDFGKMTARSPNVYPIFRTRASVDLDVGVIDDLLPQVGF
jgi:hypothetical protein